MIKYIIGKVLDVLKAKPFRLWGMSLLASLLICIAGVVGVLPIITIPVTLVLQLGMSMVYLAGYRGKNYDSEDLFKGFSNFGRNAGGMAWMFLWIFIWGMIPIVGPIFAIMKTYAYRFTPYILINNPEVPTTHAIKKSMEMTNGYRNKMFLTDLLIYAVPCAAALVLGLLGLIPYVGVLFILVLVVVMLVYAAFSPLVLGLVGAAYYDEINNGVDMNKFAQLAAQKELEKQLKAQMKAQMEAQMAEMKRQQEEQLRQMQAQQLAAQQAAMNAAQAQPPVTPEEKK